MPERLKIIVAYDGAGFEGWQSQLHRNTIQDHLEQAFRRITGARVRVHGAGRTDAGVHALGQCAHADLADRRMTASNCLAALNAILPPRIRVLRARFVSQAFHARYSVTGKVYRYRIWTGPILPPHEFQRSWHIPVKLDFDLLATASNQFVGRHNFAGFAANRGKSKIAKQRNKLNADREESTIRTIRSVKVRRRGPLVTIEFDGDGFLYKMVRLAVGASVQVAKHKLSTSEIADRLGSGSVRGQRFSAPADGLFLVRVWY